MKHLYGLYKQFEELEKDGNKVDVEVQQQSFNQITQETQNSNNLMRNNGPKLSESTLQLPEVKVTPSRTQTKAQTYHPDQNIELPHILKPE